MARRRARPGGAAGRLARYAAPAAFLLAVTGVVLAVRSALRSDAPAARTTTVVTRTGPGRARPAQTAPKRYYVIASGDTLGGIAQRFGTTVDALLRLNPGIEPTALHPGDDLRVK